MSGDIIAEKVGSQLKGLKRSEILRTIRYVERKVDTYLEEIARSAKSVNGPEKEEHSTAFFKHGHHYYRALTSLLEKHGFAKIAEPYRARAELYDESLQGKIDLGQFEQREKESAAAKLSALTDELAALDKTAPPKAGALKALPKLGDVLSEVILLDAALQLGDPPDTYAFNHGMIALNDEDYARAAQFLRPLAERGDQRAQFWIGYMHQEGQGLPQDLAEAFKWLQRSADQDESGAQHLLGWMYANGDGGPQDLVSAYMWLALAASQGHERAAEAIDQIGRHMNAAQIAVAEERLSEWKPLKPVSAIGPKLTEPLVDEVPPPRPLLPTIRSFAVRAALYAVIIAVVIYGGVAGLEIAGYGLNTKCDLFNAAAQCEKGLKFAWDAATWVGPMFGVLWAARIFWD